MLYYLGEWLVPFVGAFNVLTYITVRAGGAAFSAFLITLLIGPRLIHRLRLLKLGQYIREDHVQDLHALHKSKAGTPTMGGTLIIFSAVASLVLWGRFSNRLLLLATVVLCVLGAIGFLDDYIKIRRKHNMGLTAKAKFAGQILVGLAVGLYVLYRPVTLDATHLSERDVTDWRALMTELFAGEGMRPGTAAARFRELLPPEICRSVEENPWKYMWRSTSTEEVRRALNGLLSLPDLYDAGSMGSLNLTKEGRQLLQAHGTGGSLSTMELARLNRLLLEATFPDSIPATQPDLHTRVEVPGFRWVLIPLGAAYVLLVVVILVSSSNAVNLTDGLDGLAAGASIMSLLAYTAIAYVVSRSDWSSYLYLIYVPEAAELTVFGAALLGAGLGFLWFNCHPADVFMGDTGSLALGGAIGTMAILTKQELLLVVVGGLFVLEALSVLLQVASFKLRGKRIFKMAPIHHHFELAGWSETKVTTRFWIISLIFALMSLGALKFR
ncbi:MAG TPA: phospho-N-acetylmuramoyl-pentapeptide-transferase [Candidatus Hydrogenedentes bacterium]|jgi:phospho-N-acetylmuramoyl-pentapeptide-transferase|nr:phospho-N-acetylmuramoyl-pentapeptide-transferase [Candidatus Hydrogenedentota bacterium]